MLQHCQPLAALKVVLYHQQRVRLPLAGVAWILGGAGGSSWAVGRMGRPHDGVGSWLPLPDLIVSGVLGNTVLLKSLLAK